MFFAVCRARQTRMFFPCHAVVPPCFRMDLWQLVPRLLRNAVMNGPNTSIGLLQKIVALSLVWCSVVSSVTAQPLPQGASETADNVQQRELLQLLRETEQSLAEQNWVEAATQFDSGWQRVCSGEDPLLTPAVDQAQPLPPGQSQLLAGGRSRLIDLFRSAPAAFREEYKRQYAPSAEPRLGDAVQSGDPEVLRDVATRWRFLPAGETAVRVLARIALERGEFLEATLQLERLRQLSDQRSEGLELQIALSAWRAGLDADALSGLTALVEQNPGGTLRIGTRDLKLPQTAADSAAWLASVTGRTENSSADRWLQPFGDFRRSQSQPNGPVELNPEWTSDLFQVNDVLYQSRLNPVLSKSRELLKLLTSRFLSQNSTVVPVPSPLALDNQLIFRTVAGVRAVKADTGELLWETTHPDGRLRTLADPGFGDNSEAGAFRSVPFPGNRRVGSEEAFQQQAVAINSELVAIELFFQLTRTNTAGQMAATDRNVFVCEDSAWVTWSADPDSRLSVSNRLPANYLRAYDTRSGVFRWEAGGQRASGTRANMLGGFYFLGAPLVLGSRIYVLAESSEGIFLLQIGEPLFQGAAPEAANPRVLHSQLLAVPQYDLQQHPVRKHAGLIPSYGQGLIVCPTCDEQILAVSAEDHSVRWAYRYAGTVRLPDLGAPEPVLAGALSTMHSRSVDLNSRWTDSLPRIVANRVVVTPRDADQLFCLDLQSGRELFRIPRGNSRTVAAVTADYLILSGTRSLTAFSMQNGEILWQQEIRDGQISGNAAFDDRVVHVPTTAPAIVSFEMSNGRRLLTRTLQSDEIPGNLLSVQGRLFSQNLTSVSLLGSTRSNPAEDTLGRVQELLLAGRTNDAVEQLNKLLSMAADPVPLRELLIDVLLESLRVDFTGNSQHIPRLRSLISETSVDNAQVAATLFSMLGMVPADAAILPAQLEQLDESGQRMDYLFELIVKGLAGSRGAPVEQLSASLSELLPELLPAQERLVTSGFLARRNSRLLISGIRRVMEARTAEDRQALQNALATRLKLLLQPADGDATLSPTAGARLIRDLRSAGLEPEDMPLDNQTSHSGDFPARNLLDEQRVFHSVESGRPQASALLTALWDRWLDQGNQSAVQAMRNDLLSADGGNPLATLKFTSGKPEELKPAIDRWLADHASALSEQDLWQGQPVISRSDDSSTWPAGQQRLRGPQTVLPQFGRPGLYRGWSFVQEADQPDVAAFDAEGTRRWSFRPGVVIAPQPGGLLSERYVMTCGHLVAIKLNQMLFMLDASDASATVPPRLLWQNDLLALHQDDEARLLRQYVPGWERVMHYAPQPAGLYPCGPLTFAAMPVISGRRLFVFDSLSGERNWQLDGIPQDALLMGTDTQLLILSESERQVEVRDLIDGELLSVAPVPDWWIDANENVGASVQDVDVEPGMNLYWRVVVSGRSCVLFRLGSDNCSLECRDIVTNQMVWSVELPQKSVFSNVAEDMVAVLSNGSELRLFRLDTGLQLTSLTVTPVKNPRELYLRPSLGMLLVLPEAVEDPSLDLDIVGSGLHVFGRMFAVDRKTMQLAWDQPLDHRYIRPANATPGPILANAPVLVLLARGPRDDNRPDGARATVYSTRIVDVLTGRDLHLEKDVGNTLSYHWMTIDAGKHQVQVGFDRHILTFDYGQPPVSGQ